MNRKERRKQAKNFTPQKFNMMQNEMRWTIRKECEENANKRVEAFIQSYTTLVIYVLWYKFGIGPKRMKEFENELKKHLEILANEKKYELTLDDMYKELKEKAHIDLRFIDDGKKIDKK